jgi:hypothetical protein
MEDVLLCKIIKNNKCEHGIRKSRCLDCGGSEMCEHNKRKSRCKDCEGS